jgi:hypothetical protein
LKERSDRERRRKKEKKLEARDRDRKGEIKREIQTGRERLSTYACERLS